MRRALVCWIVAIGAITCMGVARAGERAWAPRIVRATALTNDGAFKQRPQCSPNGASVLYSRHETNVIRLFVVPRAGGEAKRLRDESLPEYDGVWSADGERIAFVHVSQSGTQGDLDVVTCSAEGRDVQPLATTGDKLSHEESPAWSSAGDRVAYSSTREGNQEIFSATPDGADVIRLTNHGGHDAHPAWSPDGERIAFATDRWGDLELASCRADGSDVRRLTESPRLDDYPAYSPDGRTLAFVSLRDGDFDIYLMEVSTGRIANATARRGFDNFPSWTPDGALLYVSEQRGRFEVYVAEIAWGEVD